MPPEDPIDPPFDSRTSDRDPASMTEHGDRTTTERTGSSTTAGHRAAHQQADLQGEPTTGHRPPEVIGLPFSSDEMAVLRDCVAAAVADLLMKIDMHGGMDNVPPQARERWGALIALAPKVGLDL